MRDRTTILEALSSQRRELEARYRSMPTDVLDADCSDSEHPGGGRWTPKDHLAHLLRIEEAFLAMARRTLDGDPRPIRFSGSSRPEILAGVHRDNEEHILSLREVNVEHLLSQLHEARERTLAFIATLTDDQLDMPIPGAPWSDGTIGGVLAANAGHEHQHMRWVDEGLATTPGAQ